MDTHISSTPISETILCPAHNTGMREHAGEMVCPERGCGHKQALRSEGPNTDKREEPRAKESHHREVHLPDAHRKHKK